MVHRVCNRKLTDKEGTAVYALLLLEKLIILRGAGSLSSLRTTHQTKSRRSRSHNSYHPSRCNQCVNCLRKPCGECIECLDKPALGGSGIRKKPCMYRICVKKQ